MVYRGGKQAVVEIDDICFASAVDLQSFHAYRERERELGFRPGASQTVQYSPVAVSPAVNGLFHITHNKAVCSLRKSFEQQ